MSSLSQIQENWRDCSSYCYWVSSYGGDGDGGDDGDDGASFVPLSY